MNATAAPQMQAKLGLGRWLGLSLAMVGLLSAFLLTGSAGAAAPPVKNGKITACYELRGKAKGSMRLLAGKGRCKRGERKLSWNVVGPAGSQGGAGAQGEQGTVGTAGPQGNPGAAGGTGSSGGTGSLASLETKVASLSVEVNALEDLLEGVSSGDLSGALGKLNGISDTQLDEAVASVPVVSSLVPKVASVEGLLSGVGSGDLEGLVSDLPVLETTVTSLGSTVTGLGSTVTGLNSKTGSLCTQASNLTSGLNGLNTGVSELKVLGLVGLSLDTSSLPSKLGTFNCP
ncbi:MAG: hypothetical protein ABW065_05115 [Solirubrobacterales bacterium]